MVFSKALVLAAIFATMASAAPMQQKRALVYETVTEVDVTTIDTTITIYPGEPTPTDVVAAVTTTAAAVTSAAAENVATTSSTSIYVPAPAPAPQTSSSSSTSEPAPTSTVAPVTTYAPAPTTSSTSSSSSSTWSTSTSSTSTSTPPASTSTGGSSLSGSGDGTYYDTATSMSAPSYCDTANDGETTNVVALSYEIMDESLCGATITVEYNGKTATGTVVEKCMGCDSQSVDMSRHMFEELSDLSAGRISVTWSIA